MPHPTTAPDAAESLDRRFAVTVTCATVEQARTVLRERIGYDEDYGFEYSIDWATEPLTRDPAGADTTTFTFAVTVGDCDLADARQVVCERIGYDEDYGFDYTVDWNVTPLPPA